MGIANHMLSSCHFVQTGEKPLHWQLELLFFFFSSFFRFPFPPPPPFLHSLEHNHRLVFVLHFIFHFCLEINLWLSFAVCFSSFSMQTLLIIFCPDFCFWCFLSLYYFFELQYAHFEQGLRLRLMNMSIVFNNIHCKLSRLLLIYVTTPKRRHSSSQNDKTSSVFFRSDSAQTASVPIDFLHLTAL